MAESKVIVIDSSGDDSPPPCEDSDQQPTKKEKDPMECPICLQTCIHPARLPCGHIFCFLCVKGVAYKNRRCAMCRREIPPEFLEHPQLVHGVSKTKTTDDGYQWYYEGRNGWWQYDERTSQDIEEAYKKGEKSCTILVAGYVYVVDFEAMLQQRQNDPSRRRHVKRDLASIPIKGVAGLRLEGSVDESEADPQTSPAVATSHERRRSSTTNFISPIAATDTAIRIATDIIDSTLAHADDSIGGAGRDQNTGGRGQGEPLDDADGLLNVSQGTSIVGAPDHSDYFSQTLDNFRSLTIQNVVDSSDSDDDNEQIIL